MSLHYNGGNNYLFDDDTEIKLKAKNCSNSIMSRKHFQDFSVDNIKKTGLNGYDYDFTVDYDAIAVDDILDIRKYLMKKNGMIKNV